ncbi:MAG: OpgC domain-containing protein [Planctomycetaceae bacterium]|nr:OpgC domain-containing protein [Planctomycetaceae bacterium]
MTPPPPNPRDGRVDLLKGLALAMIFLDHVEDAVGVTLFSRWTLRAFGPSDAAELFVLLTGLVVGRSYASRLVRDGFVQLQRYATLRTLLLYAGYVATAVTLVLLIGNDPVPSESVLAMPGDAPGGVLDAITAIVTLSRAPYLVHILVLYLPLLALSPLLVTLGRKSIPALLALSAAIYAWTLWGQLSGRQLSLLTECRWYFQPTAWQFLYCLGLAGGIVWERRSRFRSGTTTVWTPGPAAAVVAALLLAAGWILRPDRPGALNPVFQMLPRQLNNLVIILSIKQSLGPVRLIHSLAVFTAVCSVVPSAWSLATPRWLSPLAAAGRHSLLVYATGTVLTVLAVRSAALLDYDILGVLFIEIDGLLLLASAAVLRSHISRRRRDTHPAVCTV